MEQRMIDFIAALRVLGVRVSVAESGDAFEAVQFMGVKDQDIFRTTLRTTLVKEARDLPQFDQLFPLYFGSGGPPLLNALEDLTPEEKRMLATALRALLQQLRDQKDGDPNDSEGKQKPLSSDQLASLMNLLQMLLAGQNPTNQEMEEQGNRAGLGHATHPYQQRWIEQRMQRQFGLHLLNQLLDQLWDALAEAGLSQEAIKDLQEMVEGNRDALMDQISQHVGSNIAQQSVKEKQEAGDDDRLMQRPFQALDEGDRDKLRQEVRRLAAQLRSKVALRQKRGKVGKLDVKRTIRSNMRYGSIPFDLKFKTKHLKPKLVMICDVSTSMRAVVEFFMSMIYQLQDQVAKARSFAFIDNIAEISDDFNTYPPREALEIVLERMRPGYYNTDLGFSLATFTQHFFDAVDHRTTVIFVGDARNNHNNPRLDCIDQIKRRAKRVIWLTPEKPQLWGDGDSDMWKYVPFCDTVHQVGNMAELTVAIDRLLVP